MLSINQSILPLSCGPDGGQHDQSLVQQVHADNIAFLHAQHLASGLRCDKAQACENMFAMFLYSADPCMSRVLP